MRLAFFATSGPMSLWPLEAVVKAGHEIVALVRPRPRSATRGWLGRLARRLGLRPSDPIETWAGERGIVTLRARSGRDEAVVRELRARRPELYCISTFRWLLEPELLAIPPLGAVNLHASLLPRHRGPLPLFWTYHSDDRVAGVTVHRVDARADAGEILAQESFPLARGFPVERLDEENARRGAALLAGVTKAMADGRASGRAQDESRATLAPALRRGARMVRFDEWDVERVWHYTAGLLPRYEEPLEDETGRAIGYSGVLGFERTPPPGPLGRVRRAGDGSGLLACRDGVVRLALRP